VRLCGTGEVVVVHDPDLLRIAGDPAEVATLPWRELRRRDVGGTLAPGERVALLDEVLDLLRAPSCDRIVNVELKPDHVDRPGLARAVARTIERRAPRERDGVLLSTFDPRIAAYVRAMLPRAPLALLIEPTEVQTAWGLAAAIVLRAGGLHPPKRLCTRAQVGRWRRLGWWINAWTPNTPAHWSRLDAAGVDGLITDDPRGALAHFGPK
jgi:glycerophosphoryl diester phosphodiesterase